MSSLTAGKTGHPAQARFSPDLVPPKSKLVPSLVFPRSEVLLMCARTPPGVAQAKTPGWDLRARPVRETRHGETYCHPTAKLHRTVDGGSATLVCRERSSWNISSSMQHTSNAFNVYNSMLHMSTSPAGPLAGTPALGRAPTERRLSRRSSRNFLLPGTFDLELL